MKKAFKLMLAALPAFVVAFIVISSFHLDQSARVNGEDGTLLAFKIYRSIIGQIYIETAAGDPLILYSGTGIVTYPDGDVPIVHTRSWIVLNPIRSLTPVDPPITLGFDPHVEIKPTQINLNVAPTERVTIRF
jgi:hypothetical protein